MTVMASYNSWNGVKCHGHEYLLTQVLKKELGFSGFVISDWDGIDQLSSDPEDAIVLGANAGIDMFMAPEDWKPLLKNTIKQVKSGEISQQRLDEAVAALQRAAAHEGEEGYPRWTWAWLSGVVNRQQGRFDEAIRNNPNDPGAYYSRGLARMNKRMTQEGLADFNKAIEVTRAPRPRRARCARV